MKPPERILGRVDGLREAVTMLHQAAQRMNDPGARDALNAVAHDVGIRARGVRVESGIATVTKTVCPVCMRGNNAWLNCQHAGCSDGRNLVDIKQEPSTDG